MIQRAHRNGLLALVLISNVPMACGDDDPPQPEPQLAEGIYAPLGEVLPNATDEQKATFTRGQEVAEHRFTGPEGLGPSFNVTFCGSCHEDPVLGGSGPRYRNFLLTGQRLSDGSFVSTGVNGVQPVYTLDGKGRIATDDATNVKTTRNAIPFFGSGLIAEIPDSSILAYADPDDLDGDGISGRPNYDRGFVGRFGRKSQTVSLEGFIRGPLFNHAGITSNPLSDELKNRLPIPSGSLATRASGLKGIGKSARGQAAAPDEPTEDDDGVPDPELAEQDLFDLVAFAMLVAAPEPDAPTPETEAGRVSFEAAGCAGCHVPALLSPRGLIPLYSDLLLHDMGDDLADGFPMKDASGREFRTQPLWGVVATGPYLHDGRADTLDDAIRMHGGEAQASRDAYVALADTERSQVLAFLASLGGRDQDSPGLLPPNAPIPSVGMLGGPAFELTADEEAQFLRGRAFFDDDLHLPEGLGPAFNGDSCRACHFEPAIGGAGPAGVNVIRHGYDDGQTFTAPSVGTMAYKLLTTVDQRPEVDENATVFEFRQTPSLFGLGRIGAIVDSEIVANEDPLDMDGDGISGVAHRLPDGRLGRFGWKAGVPSVPEFSRDAVSNELGVTLPEVDGLTFGFLADGDNVADPEISVETLEDLTFFMAALAPPARRSTDAAQEARGETVFAEVGCDGCHIPSLPDADGEPVWLYSDLLLHDIVPADFRGIQEGEASPREFRTPPLWGIGDTGPYMHDGRAFTLEDAIARHESEGETSRTAYEALDAADRAALLAFLQSL